MIDLTEFKSRGGEPEPLVVIQWDCGFRKSYTVLEMHCLRGFDLGPAGKCYYSCDFEVSELCVFRGV